MEKYWENKELKGKIKKIWARMRCGSVGKSIHKGFRETKCTFFKKEEEILAHICECKEAEETIQRILIKSSNRKRFQWAWSWNAKWILPWPGNPCKPCINMWLNSRNWREKRNLEINRLIHELIIFTDSVPKGLRGRWLRIRN